MKRVLLTGRTGQVGIELLSQLSTVGTVIAPDRTQLDLLYSDALVSLIRDLQPDLIVNAAAYTAVDRAETEEDTAIAINGTAPSVMAETAQALGIPMLHISTDYVFDGTANTPYAEDALTSPISAYGRSKLLGELGVQQCDRHFIIRTAWVYGAQGQSNFVKTMLRLGASRDEIRVVMDQIGSPTCARDLAIAITTFAMAILADYSHLESGIYHITNSGVASWYDLAIAVMEEAQALGFPLIVQQVLPISTRDYPTLAKRPAYSVLSNRRAIDVLGHPLPHWRKSLRAMLSELYSLSLLEQATD